MQETRARCRGNSGKVLNSFLYCFHYNANIKALRTSNRKQDHSNKPCRYKAATFLEQTKISNEELALAQTHFSMIQTLAMNPESFLIQFAHPSQRYTPEGRAAVKIQSMWRGHTCRAKLGLIWPYGVRHARAAIQIQRMWRGYATRSKSVYCARKVTKQKAAVAIQKVLI